MPLSSYRLVHMLIGSDGSEMHQLVATLRVTDIPAVPKIFVGSRVADSHREGLTHLVRVQVVYRKLSFFGTADCCRGVPNQSECGTGEWR